MGLRAEGYVRDSTLDQRDGYGPELQRRAIQTFAESYGLIFGETWYTDFITGTSTLKRSGFRKAIDDAQLDKFDVLLVYHTSRFARNRADAIRYKEEIRKLGKIVIFVSQGIISGNDNDFLNEGINEVLDEHYSRILSRWIRDGLQVKASEGYSLGKPPLGFRHEPRTDARGVWAVPDTHTLPALIALLNGYATANHSFRTLAHELNAKGHRTNRGRPFTESSISTALNNPFYEGKVMYHRGRSDQETREGIHNVPDEVTSLWRKCQQVRAEKATRGRSSPPSREHHVFPLTGVLTCDNCGAPFHGVAQRSGPKTHLRMWHSKRRCSMSPVSVLAPTVEKEFAERVLDQVRLDDGWREAVLRAMANEGPNPDHTLEIKRIQGAIANLRKQHLWGAITDDEFKAEFKELKRQRRLTAAMPTDPPTPNLDSAANLLRDIPSLWCHPGVTPEQRRDLAREVFEEVRISEGSLLAVKPRPVYAPLFAYSIWGGSVIGDKRSS